LVSRVLLKGDANGLPLRIFSARNRCGLLMQRGCG